MFKLLLPYWTNLISLKFPPKTHHLGLTQAEAVRLTFQLWLPTQFLMVPASNLVGQYTRFYTVESSWGKFGNLEACLEASIYFDTTLATWWLLMCSTRLTKTQPNVSFAFKLLLPYWTNLISLKFPSKTHHISHEDLGMIQAEAVRLTLQFWLPTQFLMVPTSNLVGQHPNLYRWEPLRQIWNMESSLEALAN